MFFMENSLPLTAAWALLWFCIRHSDSGCDEPGQPGSSGAAAGGRRDDVQQVTDAAASGHPRRDCG